VRRSLLTYAHGITTVSMKKVTVQLSEKGNQEKHPASGVGGAKKWARLRDMEQLLKLSILICED
jgi:hypothetical protein